MNNCKVIVEGTCLAGFDPQKTCSDLAKLIGQDDPVARRLLDGRPRTVKSGVDERTATRYVDALRAIGVASRQENEVLILDLGVNSEKTTSEEPAYRPKAAGSESAAKGSRLPWAALGLGVVAFIVWVAYKSEAPSMALFGARDARAAECNASKPAADRCYLNAWDGDPPGLAATFASTTSEKLQLQGLAHILRFGNVVEVKEIYDPKSGACGSIQKHEGQYAGNTYQGTFYCDKTPQLTTLPAAANPTTYASGTDPFVGTWIANSLNLPLGSERWEFRGDGTLHVTNPFGSKEPQKYRLWGDGIAFSWDKDKWWLYSIRSVSNDSIELVDASLLRPPEVKRLVRQR